MRLLLLLLLFFAPSAFAQVCPAIGNNLQLQWDPTPSNVTEVRLYSSSTSGTQDLTAPIATIQAPTSQWQYAPSFLLPDGVHYFVVTAANALGNNSGPSNEVCRTLNQTIPGPPTNLVIVTVTVTIQQ